jgi:Tfp pilus assembly protein PilF
MLLILGGLALGTLRQCEKWRSSETLWTSVVSGFPVGPDYIDAYVNLGAVYAESMRLEEAEKVLRTAVAVDSMSADAFYNLAHVLYLRGEWEDAAELFRRTTVVDTTYAKGFYNFAIVSSQLGRDDAAVPAMRHAARLGMREAKEALEKAGIPVEGDETTIPLDRK